MGARHVAAVYARWSHLPDRPFRLLSYMALIARDASTSPAYWGGRAGLCLALGLEDAPSSHRVVRRAVADLVTAGALARTMQGHAGKRSEYALILDPGGVMKRDTPVPLSESVTDDEGGQQSPPKGGHLSPERGTPESGKGDTSVPPRNMRKKRSEGEDEESPLKVTPDRAREVDAILRKAAAKGVDVAAVIRRAPGECTRSQRKAWAAEQINRADPAEARAAS